MQIKRLKKTVAGLFLSTSIIFTSAAMQPLEVQAAGVDGYLVQADQYLAVDDPVNAMKVIVNAINVCGKDARLVAKADDIRSHTIVTSRKDFTQNGELGVNPVSSEMVFLQESRKNLDAGGAWTSSSLGVYYRTTPPSESWFEYVVTSDVPADVNGLCQTTTNRVSYDAAGRVSRILYRNSANISLSYRVPFAGGGGSEKSTSSMGPYLVKEFQYDALNRVTTYYEYYVGDDETTKVFYKGYTLRQYSYGADGSRVEYKLEGSSNTSRKTYPGSKVHRLTVETYNSVGQLTDSKGYIYSGEEGWVTVEACMAKGKLLDHYSYTYPTSYQRAYTHQYKFYNDAAYTTSQVQQERVNNDLEMDEQGNLVPGWTSINDGGDTYSIKRDAAGRLTQLIRSWNGGDETVTYTYNQAGKITGQTTTTRDGQFTYTEKRKVIYTPDGGYVMENYRNGKLATKLTFDRFGNRTQYLDYEDSFCDCLEENDTYNYDGSILTHVTKRHKGANAWITGDFYEYDYFGNITKEALSLGQSDSWPLTYFYQYTYHYDPNHFIPQGYDIR